MINDYADLIVRLSARSTLLDEIGSTIASELMAEAINAIYDLRDRLDKVESYLDYIDSLNKRKVKA